MTWVGEDLKDHQVPTLLPQAGLHPEGCWLNGVECRIIFEMFFARLVDFHGFFFFLHQNGSVSFRAKGVQCCTTHVSCLTILKGGGLQIRDGGKHLMTLYLWDTSVNFLGEMYVGGQEHFYLETHCTLAVPKGEDGEMELFVSTQNLMKTQVGSL